MGNLPIRFLSIVWFCVFIWPSICIHLLSILNNDSIVMSSSILKLLSCLRFIFSTKSNIFLMIWSKWWSLIRSRLKGEIHFDSWSKQLFDAQICSAADHICHYLSLVLWGRWGFRGLGGDNMFVRADAAIFQRYSNPASALAAACLLVCWRLLFALSWLKCWFKHRTLQVTHDDVLIWIGFESLVS